MRRGGEGGGGEGGGQREAERKKRDLYFIYTNLSLSLPPSLPLLTRAHRGKGLAAFLKAIGYLIPLMDNESANYYTREVMTILIREFQSPDEEMKKIVLKVCMCVCMKSGRGTSHLLICGCGLALFDPLGSLKRIVGGCEAVMSCGCGLDCGCAD